MKDKSIRELVMEEKVKFEKYEEQNPHKYIVSLWSLVGILEKKLESIEEILKI